MANIAFNKLLELLSREGLALDLSTLVSALRLGYHQLVVIIGCIRALECREAVNIAGSFDSEGAVRQLPNHPNRSSRYQRRQSSQTWW